MLQECHSVNPALGLQQLRGFGPLSILYIFKTFFTPSPSKKKSSEAISCFCEEQTKTEVIVYFQIKSFMQPRTQLFNQKWHLWCRLDVSNIKCHKNQHYDVKAAPYLTWKLQSDLRVNNFFMVWFYKTWNSVCESYGLF